ncbi:unnamed protein product [Caenorhabditis brenneri]
MTRDQPNSLLIPGNTGHDEKTPINGYLYFFAGFLLSTLLAIAAFGCSTIIWHYKPETGNNKTCTPPTESPCLKRIVGYYSGWEYREISAEQLSKLTHIIFAFVTVNSTWHFSFESEGKETLFLRMKDKAKAAGVKVMISISYDRSKHPDPLIPSLLDFIHLHRIDGVDLIFEWYKSPLIEMTIDTTFMKELRSKFAKTARDWGREEPYLISIMTPATYDLYESHLDALLGYVDFINVHSMNYEKHWKTGHGSFPGEPLTLRAGVHKKSIDGELKYIACASRSPSRLNMPINFYYIFWSNKTDGTPLPYRRKNTIAARYLRTYTENTTVDYDKKMGRSGKTLYILSEDEESIREKMKYAEEKNIGGVVIWRIEFDDDQLTLLNALASKVPCIDDRNKINYDCY